MAGPLQLLLFVAHKNSRGGRSAYMFKAFIDTNCNFENLYQVQYTIIMLIKDMSVFNGWQLIFYIMY